MVPGYFVSIIELNSGTESFFAVDEVTPDLFFF